MRLCFEERYSVFWRVGSNLVTEDYESLEVTMRVCFQWKVRNERLEEYKRCHADVWPEMLDALRSTGWSNYSLFLRSDGLLVGYLETEDFGKARADMKEHPVNNRRQTGMSPFVEAIGKTHRMIACYRSKKSFISISQRFKTGLYSQRDRNLQPKSFWKARLRIPKRIK
jgi:L-rhamnose mutarotase